MPIPAYYDAPDGFEGSVPMRGDDPRHDAMFNYITPEARVRPDHPLRPIRRMTDAVLQALAPRFDRLYSTIGRAAAKCSTASEASRCRLRQVARVGGSPALPERVLSRSARYERASGL
jgi:hypothetical protein